MPPLDWARLATAEPDALGLAEPLAVGEPLWVAEVWVPEVWVPELWVAGVVGVADAVTGESWGARPVDRKSVV